MGDGPADAVSAGRRLFAANIRRREERIDIALALLLIAREEYPRLVLEDYLERLDLLAAGLAVEIDLEGSTEAVARTVASYLARDQGFAGDRDDYYNPANSYLSEVMDRRLGLPITLSAVYIEVARRVGVTLLPVSMPGHFLVKLARPDGELFLDPFNGGAAIDLEGCQQLYERITGAIVPFRESMLGAATKRQLVTRVLANLKSVYLDNQDIERALRTVEFLLLVTPWDLDQVRDRGLLNFRLGRRAEASADLQAYIDHAPPGAASDTVRAALRRLAAG